MGVIGMKPPKVGLLVVSQAPITLNRVFQLVTTDEKKTVIAQFYRARCFPKKKKARLEVQPEGMKMLDHIVLTFVFADNKRRERERMAHSAGG